MPSGGLAALISLANLISSSITSTVVSPRFWYFAMASSSFFVNSLAWMAFF